MVRPLILSVAFFWPFMASGQVVVGRVLEEPSRLPVAGAAVMLAGSDGARQVRVVADSAGAFLLHLPTAGGWIVQVEHIAYARFVSQPIQVGPGETIVVDIRLGRTAIPLEPLVVTARTSDSRLAGFHERRATRFFGRYLTREEIESRPGARTTDLLRTVPGVTLQRVRARNRERNLVTVRGPAGPCEPAIYIDGVRAQQSADASLDELLSPETIEGVEVYTSTAGVPAQYIQPGTCGVVLFWTRRGDPTGPRMNWRRAFIGVGIVAAIVILAR